MLYDFPVFPYNPTMLKSKWIKLLIPLIVGVSVGLIYGWVIDPVQFVDTTPETLRADYRADYVLMVAEAYRSEKDAGFAARRLAVFGSQPPAEIVNAALQTGRESGYSSSDLILLQELFSAMQGYQPSNVPSGAMP
jgi:hypothetical protein